MEELSDPPGRAEQADFPRVAHLMCNLAVGFCQALSADRRSPEGLGAWENRTGRLEFLRASRGNTRFENPQPCFGLLLTDYYLQEAREAVKNPRVTRITPHIFRPQSGSGNKSQVEVVA
jgi:hypothetical protein